MSADDLAPVAQLLAGGAAPPASAPASERRPVGFQVPAREVGGKVAAEVGKTAPLRPRPDAEKWTLEEARIVALLDEGKGPREVVIELFGVKGGDKYSQAAAKVNAVIARLAARG